MDCVRCGRPAVIFQPYSGLSLCTPHLIEDIRKKGKKTVRNHSWLRSGDRIALAFSGDLHEIALLDFMKVLVDRRKDVSIFAIISGNCGDMDTYSGISCIRPPDTGCISPVEDPVSDQTSDPPDPFRSRYEKEKFLTSIAKKNDATALAMPYSLPDHAEWALWKAVNSEFPGLAGKGLKTGNKFRIIRPFMRIPGEELDMYAQGIVEEYYHDNNRYIQSRQDGTPISRMLGKFSQGHPAAEFAIVNIWDDIDRLVRQAGRNSPPGER